MNAIGVAFAGNSVSNSYWNAAAGGAIGNELGTLNLQNCSFTETLPLVGWVRYFGWCHLQQRDDVRKCVYVR